MIEICKTLAINIFWVLAAVLEVIMMVLLILGLLSSFMDHLRHKDDQA